MQAEGKDPRRGFRAAVYCLQLGAYSLQLPFKHVRRSCKLVYDEPGNYRTWQ